MKGSERSEGLGLDKLVLGSWVWVGLVEGWSGQMAFFHVRHRFRGAQSYFCVLPQTFQETEET